MQMNLNLVKSHDKQNNYKNSGKKDSSVTKYIHNKKREGRAFKEAVRKSLIEKYMEV